MNAKQKADFQSLIWDFYDKNKRDMPWRVPELNGQFDPYKILVSEMMLQQTQVSRVIPKYADFIVRFPNVHSLASAQLGRVLKVWSGLGYNRRAKFLWQTAAILDADTNFPTMIEELKKLPGIGHNTAAAILTYAFGQHIPFVETNIRTVYMYHFLANHTNISDSEILQLVEQTVPFDNPREFYWGLMDYGSHLKSTRGNAAVNSKHYTKQSQFKGSRREIRGAVIKILTIANRSFDELHTLVEDDRLRDVLEQLLTEGFIKKDKDMFTLC